MPDDQVVLIMTHGSGKPLSDMLTIPLGVFSARAVPFGVDQRSICFHSDTLPAVTILLVWTMAESDHRGKK
jgi:hypothetical protein